MHWITVSLTIFTPELYPITFQLLCHDDFLNILHNTDHHQTIETLLPIHLRHCLILILVIAAPPPC
jgi:hypothetical protein